MRIIPYGRQSISEEDIRAVGEVLRSEFLTQGPLVPMFEEAVAGYCGQPHAVAVNSATSALHIACQALGVGPGDRVWTTPNTFVASANCARLCGAEVDFVDIEKYTWNMDVSALAEKLETAASERTLPKVVIPVDFGGQPCSLLEMRELANRFGFKIIDDASHAIGSTYRGRPLGAGDYADITVFSFHPVKIITSGEGGIAVTGDPALAARMRRLRSHGVTRDRGEMVGRSEGPWYYEMIELGCNYRITDLHAALGLSQFKRLEEFVSRRRRLADRYDELLEKTSLTLPTRHPESSSAWHLYVVGWDAKGSGKSRLTAFEELRAAGIGVNVHYIPVHLQPYYQRLGFRRGQYPVSEQYYENALTIPMYAGLTDADQGIVADALCEALGK